MRGRSGLRRRGRSRCSWRAPGRGAAPPAPAGHPAALPTRRASRRWSPRAVVSARRPGGAVQQLLARHGVRTPPELGARLAAAGVSRAGAAEQVMALKCALAAGAALVVAPTALSASSGAALALLAVAPAAAFLVPDWLIARRARLRARRLRAQAPELLERLRLGSEAGLGPERALALAAARDDGPARGRAARDAGGDRARPAARAGAAGAVCPLSGARGARARRARCGAARCTGHRSRPPPARWPRHRAPSGRGASRRARSARRRRSSSSSRCCSCRPRCCCVAAAMLAGLR